MSPRNIPAEWKDVLEKDLKIVHGNVQTEDAYNKDRWNDVTVVSTTTTRLTCLLKKKKINSILETCNSIAQRVSLFFIMILTYVRAKWRRACVFKFARK